MNTDIYTYFTIPDGESKLLYSAEGWVRIQLTLETAGPVSFSTRESVTPVLSGKGILLAADGEPSKFDVPKGGRIFIAAESINRVKVYIQPIPFLEQILFQIEEGLGGVKGLLGAAFRGRKSQVVQASEPLKAAPGSSIGAGGATRGPDKTFSVPNVSRWRGGRK